MCGTGILPVLGKSRARCPCHLILHAKFNGMRYRAIFPLCLHLSIIACMSSQDLHQQSCDLSGRAWPHRWAWVLACGVFPLIWIGGLVTTYEAGMSVPDWPTTYHSWFYPLQKWLWNFNDLFLEHSHRTIAQIDGIIAIILIVSIWRWEPRKSVRWLAAVILICLISQGVLGGLRVVLDQLVLARIHGCRPRWSLPCARPWFPSPRPRGR